MTMRLLGKAMLLLSLLLMITPWVHAAERMAVIAESANVRSGPGLQHNLLWQIEKYHPVLVLEKKGEWCRFKDFEGDQGWVSTALLGKTPCVIVQVVRGNVRTGPGTDYAIAFSVEKGIPFKVLQSKGPWTEIQHADGDKGWISNALIW